MRNDTISRSALLKHKRVTGDRCLDTEWKEGFWDGVDAMLDIIKAAPAVTSEQAEKTPTKKSSKEGK